MSHLALGSATRFLDFIQVRANAPCADYPVSTAATPPAVTAIDSRVLGVPIGRPTAAAPALDDGWFGPHAFAFT